MAPTSPPRPPGAGPQAGRPLHRQTLKILTGTTSAERPEPGDPSELAVTVTFHSAARLLLALAYADFGFASARTEEVRTRWEPRHVCDVEEGAVH